MIGTQNDCPRSFKFFSVLKRGFTSKLALPQGLIKCFPEVKTSSATILNPLDEIWHVNIEGDGKRSYFVEGWERCVQAHKLRLGDLLVFKYKGNLLFDVTIFDDDNTCEKDYNAKSPSGTDEQDLQRPSETANGRVRGANGRVSPVKTSAETDGRTKRLKKATVEMVKETTCFPSTIHHSNICTPYLVMTDLNILVKFGSSVEFSRMRKVTLLDVHSRRWAVSVRTGRRRNSQYFKFSKGWTEFQKGNNLEVGDVCNFHLKGGTKKITFQVEVIKHSVAA